MCALKCDPLDEGQHRSRPWVDTWLVEGDTRKAYCTRVSRLCLDDKAGVVGTAVRFENPYGLLLTAHHCCTWIDPSSGKTLVRDNLTAFNTPVDIVHLSSNYDLAFLLLKTGPYVGGFRLATRAEERRGRPVRMISFPWHVDNAYGFEHDSVPPTEVHGHIANLGPKEQKLPLFVDALATYMGGFAASPGGAVTLNSKVLVGIHVRAIWHQKGETILPFKGKSKLSTHLHHESISQRKDFGESSKSYYGRARNKRRRKLSRSRSRAHASAKKMKFKKGVYDYAEDHEGDPECSTGICSSVLRDSARRKEGIVVNSLLVKRNGDAKCSMYHGYLSTYLSARHIIEEYNNFIASWAAMEANIGKNCLTTVSSRDRSRKRLGKRSRTQIKRVQPDGRRSTKQKQSIRLNRRRSRRKRRKRKIRRRRRNR